MAIVIKLKPTKVTAKTRSQIIDKVRGFSTWGRFKDSFNHNGSFLHKRDDRGNSTARLYSLEKHNRKVHTTKRLITRGKRKGEVELTKTVVREGGWVAHYYDVPVDMLDTKATKQGTRTFKLKLK